MRRTFESRREAVSQDCRKRHNEKLHDLHSSPTIIRMKKSWAGRLAQIGGKINACKVLVGKREGKSPLGQSRPA
jgi:hypothetical protein